MLNFLLFNICSRASQFTLAVSSVSVTGISCYVAVIKFLNAKNRSGITLITS